MENLKKTPLYEEHVKAGGKLVDFGGWALPVQYSGITSEHEAVRSGAGLFDVSHMGEISVRGERAEEFVNHLVTNDVVKMIDGKCMYSPLCNENGGFVDDVLIYRKSQKDYLIVVNASNADKDFAHFQKQNPMDCEVKNVSADYAELALQGPLALQVLTPLTDIDLTSLKYYSFAEGTVCGVSALVSRTGYTGEDGFEIYVTEAAPKIWNAILANASVAPAGLGARDTLRFECCMPLYGHELGEDITPFEAMLGRYVIFEKDNFVGKEALAEKKPLTSRRRVGFEMVERGIAREHYEVFSPSGEKLGYVTSGSVAPTLKKNLGMALIEKNYEGEELYIEIRGKKVLAKRIPTPFYKRT